jgi:hypothetical protein
MSKWATNTQNPNQMVGTPIDGDAWRPTITTKHEMAHHMQNAGLQQCVICN